MNEAQVKHFIVMERQKGTTIEELIFILHDNGVPEYEISNYLEISIKYVEEILRLLINEAVLMVANKAFWGYNLLKAQLMEESYGSI